MSLERGARIRVPTHLRASVAFPRRSLAELLAYIDGKRRVVVEIEALELIVAEHDHHVRLQVGDLLAQHAEPLVGARGLLDVRLVIFDRHVWTYRTGAPP